MNSKTLILLLLFISFNYIKAEREKVDPAHHTELCWLIKNINFLQSLVKKKFLKLSFYVVSFLQLGVLQFKLQANFKK